MGFAAAAFGFFAVVAGAMIAPQGLDAEANQTPG